MLFFPPFKVTDMRKKQIVSLMLEILLSKKKIQYSQKIRKRIMLKRSPKETIMPIVFEQYIKHTNSANSQ